MMEVIDVRIHFNEKVIAVSFEINSNSLGPYNIQNLVMYENT